jgi:hypothetical protein
MAELFLDREDICRERKKKCPEASSSSSFKVEGGKRPFE